MVRPEIFSKISWSSCENRRGLRSASPATTRCLDPAQTADGICRGKVVSVKHVGIVKIWGLGITSRTIISSFYFDFTYSARIRDFWYIKLLNLYCLNKKSWESWPARAPSIWPKRLTERGFDWNANGGCVFRKENMTLSSLRLVVDVKREKKSIKKKLELGEMEILSITFCFDPVDIFPASKRLWF